MSLSLSSVGDSEFCRNGVRYVDAHVVCKARMGTRPRARMVVRNLQDRDA